MNISFKILSYFFIIVTALFLSCKKEDIVIPAETPIVLTSVVNNVQRTQAVCGAQMILIGSSPVTGFGICWNTTGSPTLNDSFTSDGVVTGAYSTKLRGLTPGTKYYVRAYATNASGTGYGEEKGFTTKPYGTGIVFNSDLTYGTVSDIEGNDYKTIIIGTQTWMAENLRTTRYNDNTEIDLILDGKEWMNSETPGYSWYENNEKLFRNTYGAYYNWLAVYSSRLCPAGWHVPSDGEWKTLEMYLGMTQEQADAEGTRGNLEGAALKEAGKNNWFSGGQTGTNESGLTGLPGGNRSGYQGFFDEEGVASYWWTSTGYYPYGGLAYNRSLYYGSSGINRTLRHIKEGFNVRCIKD
jgi:uncharacterized protein (TIGR02145 family)